MSNSFQADRPPLGRRTLVAAAATALATPARAASPDPAITILPDWSQSLGDGVQAHPYGVPSRFEKDVVRRDVAWLTAGPQSSVNFTPLHALDGTITPNGLCFERHHSGVALVDPQQHRLMIHGMVASPLVLTMQDIKRLPRTSRIYFLECAANSGMEWRGAQLNGAQFTHGMIHNVQYTGVSLRSVLEAVGIDPRAKWVMAEGADAAGLNRSIPLAKAMDDCMLAFAMNGEALRPEQGYPLRLVVPGWQGNMWVKWLRRLKVSDAPWMSREETSKYTDLMPDGRARRFTFVMDAKSVITSPSPQVAAQPKGRMVISGIAWSGRGSVARVDVSLDGGRNWQAARIDGPVQPLALVRFYADIDWNGQELLLQSRAHDSTGYVQPSKADLRKIRGVNSIYHNNGIQTWLLRPDGVCENVEVS
jgi:sulfane dehydrogenase subunit SoxC